MGDKILSVLDIGNDGLIVEIETKMTNGLPATIIVGSVNNSVNESKERVRSAIINSSLIFPRKRIVINIAPSDISKKGASLDLAIAVSILVSNNQLSLNGKKYIFIGELGLDGSLRPIRGIIGKILSVENRLDYVFVIPEKNLAQSMAIKGLRILPISSLTQLYQHLSDVNVIDIQTANLNIISAPTQCSDENLSEVVGQYHAKRALEIAAAGGHNLLLTGPPGTGKTMLAKSIVGILPAMNEDEILEVTHLHSLFEKNFESLQTNRPFRSPHHTASYTAIIGGGQNPRPGEVSLSHKGVLFMDEFPEFSRYTIESLRQPLEEGLVSISRSRETTTFPANFILLATANPCPCGNFMTKKECICSQYQIVQYQKKLSGPIIDRIDLFTPVEDIEYDKLLNVSSNEDTNSAKLRILTARDRQYARYKSKDILNSNINNKIIRETIKLTDNLVPILNNVAKKLNISARAYMKTIKVSRTIADLDNSEYIKEGHIIEALQYRQRNIDINTI